MKYRFITILHNMKLDTIKNKGIEIFPGARISNGAQILSETLDTNLMQDTAGFHSIDEFKDVVYFYKDGEFEEIVTIDEMNKCGLKYTFFFLRQIQQFALHLWEIKDNNVYIRDGFLLVYEKEFNDGYTYKASLSEMFSYATGERMDSIFSDDEIKVATSSFIPTLMEDYKEESFGGKYPTHELFFKFNNCERMARAIYFTHYARKKNALPMKIVSYCTALECLFTTGKTEINHKIAERVAIMLGTSIEEKKGFYKLVKKAYDCRSTIVHGASLKGKNDDLIKISKGLDDILRSIIVANDDVFDKSDNELEDYFVDLLFINTSIE